MIRKLITALFIVMSLLILTSAWMPEVAHAQCIVGLNGLICPKTPVPSSGSSGSSSGGSSGSPSGGQHKRPPKTQLLIPTQTPSPIPTITPTDIPPVGIQIGPVAGSAGAAQNPGSSGWPWAATAIEFPVIIAIIGVLIRLVRDPASGLPGGKRIYKPTSVVTRDAAVQGTSGKVKPSDFEITKTGDQASVGVAKDAAKGKKQGSDPEVYLKEDFRDANISG